MSLETLRPNPTWDEASYQDAVDTLTAHDDLVYKVWGGDWCKDCRKLLPNLGAALEAAEVPDERIEEYALDEDKQGEGVEEYDIEYIPTVVVETTDGDEVIRFVESEDLPPAVWLATQLEAQR
ncbi:thioredoxin domain-containing protein [Natronorubrum daqingense]|uniref:Thiol-disulfide isomerase or thioredoxin n=1 Tax=Natronorubrum daqingense TaxID=588898 RepID=A0A1N6XMQ4_9EURY|nr:thioredoxin family protein [Natronorubrum daqingense]APX95910.1 thioredoxin family protein [Natronorubrum daqingense]SIR03592.1 Thiol-disulfide isomerase or thioredoxin [Natronorubrum daqingense]